MAAAEMMVPNHQYIEELGVWIDPDTGEVIGHTGEPVPEEFKMEDAESAMGRLLRLESNLVSLSRRSLEIEAKVRAKVEAALAALEDDPELIELRSRSHNVETVTKQVSKTREYFLARYMEQLKAFAQQKLLGKKSRTLHLEAGAISLTKKSAAWQVIDEVKAVDWCIANGYGDCIKREILISKLPDQAKVDLAKILANKDSEERPSEDKDSEERPSEDKDSDEVLIEDTGFQLQPESETCKLKFA